LIAPLDEPLTPLAEPPDAPLDEPASPPKVPDVVLPLPEPVPPVTPLVLLTVPVPITACDPLEGLPADPFIPVPVLLDPDDEPVLPVLFELPELV
jgi:hypothetical protein